MAIYDAPESFHVGNGVETVFGFNWPYLLPRDLLVTLNGTPVPTVLASSNQVVVAPAPAAGTIVRIFRNTPAQNPTYLFASGIPMLPRYIDGNNKQLLYALQEGLLQFRQTQATADEALRRAAAAEISAVAAQQSAAQQARDMRRTVRVPTTDPEIPTLPAVADRANKVMGFDNLGNPVGTLPASGSGTELALDLASTTPGKGAAMVARAAVHVQSVQALLAQPQRADAVYVVEGWYEGRREGGGLFVYAATVPRSQHDGGRIISPTTPYGTLPGYLYSAGETEPTATGCFVRLGTELSPLMFGAFGTGTASDAAAVERCIQISSRTGRSLIDPGGYTYLIDRDVVIDRLGDGPVVMDWNGSTMRMVNAGLTVGSERSTGSRLILATTPTADIVRGTTKFNVASTAGVSMGDLVVIESPALTSGSVNQITCYVVQDVNGGEVYVSGQIVVDQNPSQITATGQVGSITVKFYKLDKGLRFRNLTATIVDTDGTKNALNFFFQDDAYIEYNVVDGHARGGIQIQYGGVGTVHKCVFKRYGYVSRDQGYLNTPTSPNSLSFGYGVAMRRSYLTTVTDCVGLDGWHLTDCARGQTYAVHTGCVATKNSFGFATHEGSWNIRWENCHTFGGAGFDTTRCAFPTVRSCTVLGVNAAGGGHGITYRGGCVQVTLVDNILDTGGAPVVASSSIWRGTSERPLAGVLSAGQLPVLTVRGNTIRGTWGALLGQGGDGTSNIGDNTFEGGAYISELALDKSTNLLRNDFTGTPTVQHAVTIRDGYFGQVCTLTVDALIDTATPTVTVNSALINLTASLQHTIRVNRCTSLSRDAILRVANPLSIREMLGNSGRKGVLTVTAAAAVIANAVGNMTYQPFVTAPVTVTNSANNTILV